LIGIYFTTLNRENQGPRCKNGVRKGALRGGFAAPQRPDRPL
jgi:hypothetical protein